MSEMLDIHGFQLDPGEHQLEPDDRVMASYVVANRSDGVVLKDIVLTHQDRTDVDGMVVVSCEPSVVHLADRLQPHEERSVNLELVTSGELPGPHALRVRATFQCEPVSPSVEALLEYTISPD